MPIAEVLVGEAINCLLPVFLGMVSDKIKGVKKEKVDFDSISNFWEANAQVLIPGKYVSIKGALSKYAPMLIGPPKAKREVHRAYRRSIPEADYKNIKTTIDANLAFTAGQMVWRLEAEESSWVYLGLYHSIVRNSIPVFIDKDYYYNCVEEIFLKCKSPCVVEAVVIGKLHYISGSIISKFIEQNKLEGLIKPEILDAGKRVFGIVVDGTDTRIKYSGSARYLDGDIWVAVELNGEQFFVSRFLDLSDPNDFLCECEELKKDVEEFLPDGKIVFQFDQVDKLIAGYERITVNDLIQRATQR